MSTQIHATAHVSKGSTLGDGTQIGANSYVAEGVMIGANCQIGQNVSIGSNVLLLDEVIVEDDVAILGPPLIEKKVHLSKGARVGDAPETGQIRTDITFLLEDSQILAKAVISRGVRVGPRAMVTSFAHVVKDVKCGQVVGGDPAILVYLLDVEGATLV